MRNNKSRDVLLSDNISHCESFTAARNAHQCLELSATAQPFHKPFYGFWLIPGRSKLIVQFEYSHITALF
jgi:hypothetical protein